MGNRYCITKVKRCRLHFIGVGNTMNTHTTLNTIKLMGLSDLTGCTIRKATQFSVKLTARIQKTGRLGFGEKAADNMELNVGNYIALLSTNADEPITHIVVLNESNDEAFELKGSKTYPYIEAKQLFDYFSVPYATKVCIYDFTRTPELDASSPMAGKVYKASLRIDEASQKSEKKNLSLFEIDNMNMTDE